MTSEAIGSLVRKTRKAQQLNQADLALAAGTATRFISDLENGKPSCQLGKTLDVLRALGIKISLTPPAVEES